MVIFGPCPLVGAPFCGAPVRLKLLHMPKSASGGAWSSSNNVAWAEAYLRSDRYPDASSRFATVDIGRKVGGRCTPFSGGGGFKTYVL